MTERVTLLQTDSGPAWMEYGRRTRAEMIDAAIEYYTQERDDAEAALADLAAGRLVVYQQTGFLVGRDRKVVSDDG